MSNEKKSSDEEAARKHLLEGESSKEGAKPAEDSKPKIKKSEMGYYSVDKAELSYGGIFYLDEMEISYRGADTPEVRHWSTMDTNNEFDIMEHFNMLLKSCLRVTHGSWKDILEVDRFKLVMKIQEATFAEQHNPVMLNFDCFECDANNKVNLEHYHIITKAIDEELLKKYFDEESKCVKFITKNLGTIEYAPSTIGSSDLVFQFLKTKKPAYVKKNSSIIKLLPRFIIDYRSVKVKQVEDWIDKWYAWTDDKISFVTQMADKLDFIPAERAEINCSKCRTENQIRIDPEGDIKYMFLRRDAFENELT